MIIVRNQVINHILANGGSNPEGSDFIFHFQSYGGLIGCRDSLRISIPGAFHASPTVIKTFNATHGLNVPPPVPMATAWVVIKTTILSTDYRQDSNFFYV